MRVYIAVIGNGIMHGVCNLQFVLQIGKDVLQVIRVVEYGMTFNTGRIHMSVATTIT